jgi:hypothetical protein
MINFSCDEKSIDVDAIHNSGGDLMSLLKNIGFLSDEHTRFYIAETALAIHSLHKAVSNKSPREGKGERGIVCS